MHLESVETAIKHLENTGKYNVLAGYISPSQDIYVSAKLQASAISGDHRSNMAQIITDSSEKISVSTWEITRVCYYTIYFYWRKRDLFFICFSERKIC